MELPNLQIPESRLKNYVLFELKKIFNKNTYSLSDYNLLMLDRVITKELSNRLLREELDYDIYELQEEHSPLFEKSNQKQKEIYESVLDALNENKGGIFFVYGHGGTGKTFL